MCDEIEVYAPTIEEALEVLEKSESLLSHLKGTCKTKKTEQIETILGVLQQRLHMAIALLEDELHEGYMLNDFNHFNPYPEDIQNLSQQQYQQG